MGKRIIVEDVTIAQIKDALEAHKTFHTDKFVVLHDEWRLRLENEAGLGVDIGVVTHMPSPFGGRRVDLNTGWGDSRVADFVFQLITTR